MCRGVARSFDWGGGRIYVSQNHLPQNSDFFSEFAHFFGSIGKSKKMINIQELFSKNYNFWGDIPRNFEPGEAFPHPSSGDTHSHGRRLWRPSHSEFSRLWKKMVEHQFLNPLHISRIGWLPFYQVRLGHQFRSTGYTSRKVRCYIMATDLCDRY